jgi:tetratricopeptide (TPR) repeat protein
MQVQKTVFISYRRTNVFTARAVYQNLTMHGYDAFLDFENIDAGSFERVILNQIAARAHFIIILTPSALERCAEPGDWLRREIERAIDLKRNIVPLMFEGFDFSAMSKYLTGKLAVLSQYNGLRIPADFFDEALERLRTRFLNKPLEMILHPTPPADVSIVQGQKIAARQAVTVTEEWFERGVTLSNNSIEELNCYSNAIELNPLMAGAFNNRGIVRKSRDDLKGAIEDYSQAILLDPYGSNFYYNRGIARDSTGDSAGAIEDYNEAIRLNPQDASAYLNRGNVRYHNHDTEGAIEDYNEAIRLNPHLAPAYNNRGDANRRKQDLDSAMADYESALHIDPNYELAKQNLKLAQRQKREGR